MTPAGAPERAGNELVRGRIAHRHAVRRVEVDRELPLEIARLAPPGAVLRVADRAGERTRRIRSCGWRTAVADAVRVPGQSTLCRAVPGKGGGGRITDLPSLRRKTLLIIPIVLEFSYRAKRAQVSGLHDVSRVLLVADDAAGDREQPRAKHPDQRFERPLLSVPKPRRSVASSTASGRPAGAEVSLGIQIRYPARCCPRERRSGVPYALYGIAELQ